MENITMQDYINSFEHYDASKDEDVEVVERASKSKKISDKEKVSARRKKAYYKGQKRYNEMLNQGFTPKSQHDADVLQGMMKNHSVLFTEINHGFDASIGNVRRKEAADARMSEVAYETTEEVELA